MKRLAILLIMAALVSAGAYAATITPQIGGGIAQFDGGVASQGAVAAPPATCSGTGLIFNVACNSQYVPVL